MSKLRDLTGKELFRLFWPFFLFLALGVAIRYRYPDTAPFHEIVHLTADAFAVAGALGIIVELFVTGRLIEHTAHSLAHRLIGYGLPSELQGEIRKIVETTLVRFNTEKRYRLTNPRDGKITVQISYSFEVRNYGDRPEEYSPWISEEEFYAPKYTYLQYGVIGEAGHSYSEPELQRLMTQRPGDHAHEIGAVESNQPLPKVKLQPCRKHQDSICRVSWRYELTMPESYTDITSFGGAVVGVRVEAESVPEGFAFVGDGRDSVRSGKVWTYTRPFLQHQHIRVRWFRN